MNSRHTGLLAALAILLGGISASAATPSLTGIQPRGGQRGTEATLTFTGARLADTQEVLAYTPGIQVVKLDPKDAAVQAVVKIAPDCPLGEHAFRLRTASGLSELRTFWVGALPIVEEKEPNNEFTAPQVVPLNCTVHGSITSEDVDYFAVELKKGQRLSVEIEALRLGVMFDSFIAILDSKRFELATSDDTALLAQDGCLSILAPADGKYFVMVRESAYRGNPGYQYRLHIGTFPRPLAVYPAGGPPGQKVEVQFLGDPSGPIKKTLQLPAQAQERFRVHAEDAGGISPSGHLFRVSELRNVLEVEPNDQPSLATPCQEAPVACNGVIEKPGDVDHFRFKAARGQVLDIQCYARRIGSPLDSVIVLMNAQGAALASNDDSNGPDSYLRFNVPADGEYILAIRDHLNQGGSHYVYRVEIAPPRPVVTLGLPQFTQFTQERQHVAVPRGNRSATLLTVTRSNVGGDITLEASGLPEKVKAQIEPAPGFMAQTPVVFEAAADAPNSGKLATITAKPADPKQAFASQFAQKAELVYGNPNTSPYYSVVAPALAVAATDPVPFSIRIVEPKVPIVQNGPMQLKIVADRQSGFKGPITILPLYNPPGLNSVGSVTIPEGQNEVLFPINAAANAPARKWKYAVWGTATVGNGPVWVSSQLATIEVAPPYLAVQLERVAAEQGQSTPLHGKITVATPWKGPAKVKLIGLPTKVTAPDLEFSADAKEFDFAIALDPAAPVGQHKNLFCQVVVMQDGEAIVHNVGSGELRVDKPLPPKGNTASATPSAKPATPAAPAAAGEKRLSRLEQLRKEQEAREKASKKE